MDTTLKWKSTHGIFGLPLLLALHTDAGDTTDQATHHAAATVPLRRAAMKLILLATVEATGLHTVIVIAQAVTHPVVTTTTDVTTAETKMNRLLLVIIIATTIANEATNTMGTILTVAPIKHIPVDTTTSIIIVIMRMITLLLMCSRHSSDRSLDGSQCLLFLDSTPLR